MVGGTTHELFVEKMCEEFDKPKKYTNWGKAPDYGYWFSDFGNRVMHRFTLHGMANVQPCIDLLREKSMFEYDEKEDEFIKTAVASHSYLDLFNFWALPSYPKNWHYGYVSGQRKYYVKSLFSHFFPDRYQQPRPTDVISWFDTVEELKVHMVEEYYEVPDDKGFMTEKILNLYG